MGFRITSMLTIEYARKNYGTDFSRTLTLGRQFRASLYAETQAVAVVGGEVELVLQLPFVDVDAALVGVSVEECGHAV